MLWITLCDGAQISPDTKKAAQEHVGQAMQPVLPQGEAAQGRRICACLVRCDNFFLYVKK